MRYLLISFLFFASGCNNTNGETNPHPLENSTAPVSPKKENSKNKSPLTSVQWDLKYFYSTDKNLARLVDSIYNSFSLSEKAAQMIMVATSEYKGIGLPFPAVLKLYNSRITGSILFLKGKKSTFESEISTLNKASADHKIFPAVFACDCEPSLYHKKFTDADSVLPASELKEAADVQKVAAVISLEMRKMGLHWNFAPVADINSNKEIIDNRSFGDKNSEVIDKSIAFIKTSAENNIVTSVKHFPGHGAVKGDSHKNLVYIDSSLEELENFASIIRLANPISIMVGHIAIKNNYTLSTSGMPATLSKKIVTNLLKDSLAFSGIIVTDAMNMGGVKNIEDADFKAVLAGNDLILIPEQIQSLHKKIIMMLKGDEKTRKRVSTSIKKIIRLKICLGLLTNHSK